MTTAAMPRGPVLVVEDDPEIRDALCDVLGEDGYDVASAANGQEALARLGEIRRPCLVLLDLMMPVMDGGEFLAALRSMDAFATLPVVVVSAWPDKARRLRHDTQGFLKKPVALNMLLDTVAATCESPGRSREG